MTALGIWACQWRELRPITFGGSSSRDSSSGQQQGEGSGGVAGILQGVFGGRNGGGGGEYEMVGMKERSDDAV